MEESGPEWSGEERRRIKNRKKKSGNRKSKETGGKGRLGIEGIWKKRK